MPSVRCEDFNEVLWTYVAETARRRKKTRCKALQLIVEEHMKFMAREQTTRGKGRGKKEGK